MHPKTTDGKDVPTDDGQSYVQTKKWSVRKYLLIGLIVVIVTGLAVTAILVGIHIYVEAAKEIAKLQYTLKLKDGRSQDVTSDVTSNIVKYHVQDEDHEAWVVNDFNTDIKVTKIVTKTATSCYMTPLNRSTAMEPSNVKKPSKSYNMELPSNSESVVYTISGQTVSDISFLNKESREMCKGVSTYWMYPGCDSDFYIPSNSNPNKHSSIQKREAPFYELYNITIEKITFPCINGCCQTICACEIFYTWNIFYDTIVCEWLTRKCCQISDGSTACYKKKYCEPTNGLNCTDGDCDDKTFGYEYGFTVYP